MLMFMVGVSGVTLFSPHLPSGPSRCGPTLCRLSVQLPLPRCPPSPYSLPRPRLSAGPPASALKLGGVPAGLDRGPRVSTHLSR